MSTITDLSIKGHISKLKTGDDDRVELREGNGRGNGRLSIIIRRSAEGIIAEWYAVWHRDGRRQMTKMGSYPAMTLAAARKAFREDYEPDILAGKNPTGPRTWVKGSEATVQRLFEAYVEDLIRKGKKPGSVSRAKYALLSPSGAAKAIGPDRLAADIQPSDIIPYLKAIRDRGAIHHAHNVRAWIAAAFTFGQRNVHRYHEVASGVAWGIKANPAAQIDCDPEAFVPGTRHLSPEEFAAFWHWLTRKGRSFRYRLAPAIQLMMATGQRPSEILQLGPDHFDAEVGELSWDTTKNGRAHCIPLPPQALSILNAAVANAHGHYFPRQRDPSQYAHHSVCEWVLHRYLDETGAEPFTARDLRRTWKTLAGRAGLPKDIRDRIQNHALTDVASKHYDRYDYMAEKRAAMEKWGAYLAGLLTGDPDGEVAFARPVRVTKEPTGLVSPA